MRNLQEDEVVKNGCRKGLIVQRMILALKGRGFHRMRQKSGFGWRSVSSAAMSFFLSIRASAPEVAQVTFSAACSAQAIERLKNIGALAPEGNSQDLQEKQNEKNFESA